VVADFTILIPTYNEERSIGRTLKALKKQRTSAKVRVFVVDGGSTDRTVEIAKRFVKVIHSPKKGKAHQLNYGVSRTPYTPYLLFIDADTYLPTNYLERIGKMFKKDPQLWACAGTILYTGRQSGIWHTFVVLQALIDFAEFAFFGIIWLLLRLLPHVHFQILQPNFFYNISMYIYYNMRQLFKFTEFSGSNICIRRDIFEEVGGFHQPPKLGVDMMFCNILRHHLHNNKQGKIKLIPSLFVETEVRHLGVVRSLKRLDQHRKFKVPLKQKKGKL